MLSDNQMRKIIISITVAVGIGFSVLFGASFALSDQMPMTSQQFQNQNNLAAPTGFSGSNFGMTPQSQTQMTGTMNQGLGLACLVWVRT